jgi:hypothetical protein
MLIAVKSRVQKVIARKLGVKKLGVAKLEKDSRAVRTHRMDSPVALKGYWATSAYYYSFF